MKKGAKKPKKKLPGALPTSTTWPMIKRYRTKDGLSITVHAPAYAEGVDPRLTAAPKR